MLREDSTHHHRILKFALAEFHSRSYILSNSLFVTDQWSVTAFLLLLYSKQTVMNNRSLLCYIYIVPTVESNELGFSRKITFKLLLIVNLPFLLLLLITPRPVQQELSEPIVNVKSWKCS